MHRGDNQRFILVPQLEADVYTITAVNSGLSLEITGNSTMSGAKITQNKPFNSLNQQFKLIKSNVGNNNYYIQSKLSGKYL